MPKGVEGAVGVAVEARLLPGLAGRAGTARVVAEFMAGVHGFPVGRARELGVMEWDTRVEFAAGLEAVRAQVISLLSGVEGRRLLDLWDEFLSGERNFEYEPVLIHADMSIDHLLGTGDRITGVIDFGDARIGDPDYDMCYLWTGAGTEFVRRVQEYRGRVLDDRLVAELRFWEKSDRAFDILHAIAHDLPEFRDESVHALRAALARP